MKVKDLANQYNKKPKDFIRLLVELGIVVKSPNTKLDTSTVNTINDLLLDSSDELEEIITEPKKKQFNLKQEQITISDFSKLVELPLKDILGVILKKGLLLNLNSHIDQSLAKDIANDLDVDLTIETKAETDPSTTLKEQISEINENVDKNDLRSRPPIITIMGHVDHGKTLLLDKIRSTKVAESESGGITQHIGAYQIRLKNKKKMTFLDTPGHEAFTALRSRGAQITDIAILVIAADDGIKPQTIEALNHAKAAATPILVAINKIDTPGADIEKCKQQLMEHELVPEEWGGSTVVVNVSAKTGEGIDNLLEMIGLIAEVQELKTHYNSQAKAITIESMLDKKRGPTTTVLVQSGKLKLGSFVAIGSIYGKIKAMFDDMGNPIKEALPSTPVEILGLSDVPTPGDILETFKSEQIAKKAVEKRMLEQKEKKKNLIKNVSLETLSKQITSGDVKKLNIIIKADVNGSLDALTLSINQIKNDDVSINILHSATGSINENDILLAKTANAIVIGFRVPTTNDAKKLANTNKIDIRNYNIIYEIISDIENVMKGFYEKKLIETKIGTAEVRDIFKFSKIGTIAGCYVTTGKLIRNSIIKVIREKKEVFKGNLTSLKRFKDDVKEVTTEYECGIVAKEFTEFLVGDFIECYSVHEE